MPVQNVTLKSNISNLFLLVMFISAGAPALTIALLPLILQAALSNVCARKCPDFYYKSLLIYQDRKKKKIEFYLLLPFHFDPNTYIYCSYCKPQATNYSRLNTF